jgi:hypothetical protein
MHEEGCTSPQMAARTLEDITAERARTEGEFVWIWDFGIDNIADLLRYLDASNVTVQEFLQFNLYKKNVDKVPWLKELEKQ